MERIQAPHSLRQQSRWITHFISGYNGRKEDNLHKVNYQQSLLIVDAVILM